MLCAFVLLMLTIASENVSAHSTQSNGASKEIHALQELARENGFVVCDVPPDGNSALHAICDQLSLLGLSSDVYSLRRIAIEFLKNHLDFIDEGFLVKRQYRNCDAYLKQQAADGHWCDEIMLRAIAVHYDAEINILHNSGHMTKISPNVLPEQCESAMVSEIQKKSLMLGHISLRRVQGPLQTEQTDAAVEFDVTATADEMEPIAVYQLSNQIQTEYELSHLLDFLKVASWRKWCAKRKWLGMKDKKVICKECIKTNRIGFGTLKNKFLCLDSAFLTGVTAIDRKKLLKKMDEHSASKSHLAGETIKSTSRAERLPKFIDKDTSIWAEVYREKLRVTGKLFNVAYTCATENIHQAS